MWKFVVSLCLIGLTAGCGNDAASRMGASTKTEDWKERQQLDETIMGVGMAGERGSWQDAQRQLDPTGFKSALDAFSASTAPSGYDDTKKAAVVAAGDALILAQKGSAEEFSEKFKGLTSALNGLALRTAE